MINDSIDYNSLLSWKLHPKKCIDLKNDSVGDIIAVTTHHNVDIQQNNLHSQDNTSKHMTHYATIEQHQLPNQTEMIISQHPTNLNGNLHIQQYKPNENIQIQQVIPISSQNVVYVQTEQNSKTNVVPKEKNAIVKKKVKKVPVDGIAYHSKQLGLKVPPKKVINRLNKIIIQNWFLNKYLLAWGCLNDCRANTANQFWA